MSSDIMQHMMKMNRVLFLFIVIIVEGYVVLSTELLAIRQTMPFVGSGTETVSIIIAAVLMPLAFGYYFGGRWHPKKFMGRRMTIRRKLILNIIVSAVILLFGMSYVPLNAFFYTLTTLEFTNRLFLTALYAVLFIVIPVYLLGQTIPLVSNYFTSQKLSQITGRMLFFSTLGSFMGAVFSTIVLMATIGVNYTACVNFALLAFLVFLLSKKKMAEPVIVALAVAGFAFYLNSGAQLAKFNIVENNQYNNVAVFKDKMGNRNISINNNADSRLGPDGRKHEYLEFIERVAIDPIRSGPAPREILVVGSGGFTFGHEDAYNHYDFIDIDKSLLGISEEYILREKLKPNKTFHPVEARAYLNNTDKKYDIILLDAFRGDLTIPENLVTREFFTQVKGHLKENGLVIANFGISPSFRSAFSRNLDNTFRVVFPHVSRIAINEKYLLWEEEPDFLANVIYIYRENKDENATEIYTDDKNRSFYDKPQTKPNIQKQLKLFDPKVH